MGNISELLVNTSSNPVLVKYIHILVADGCSSSDTVSLIVNPKPVLSSILSAPSICDSTIFNYTPGSATLYTTFVWSRGVVTGIANAADTGSGNPNEYLDNTTVNPVLVTYIYTLTANSCTNVQSVTVHVNPKPVLSSTLTPPAICSSDTFSYTPGSLVSGATYFWIRSAVAGIANLATSGTGNPLETLVNTTTSNATVNYNYIITANSCTDTEVVTVLVKPKPVLTTFLSDTICSGSIFHYTPVSGVSGTAFTWTRSSVSGIINPPGAGTGSVNDTLTNSTYHGLIAVYAYTLTANGCVTKQNVTVKVDPVPAAALITTKSPPALCANTLYQNFGTSSVLSDSVQYSWSADNAAIWAAGSSRQYCLVNFNSPGNSVITLMSGVPGVSCSSKDTFAVNVSSAVSSMPDVIYFHYQFVCLPGNEDSYQWGFDDAQLDSTILTGETSQDYINTAPDPNKYYWVMTSKNGCTQKTYYKTPTRIINATGGAANMILYPNPAEDFLTVELSNITGRTIELAVYNMVGQKVRTAVVFNGKATIDVSGLPSGSYVVGGYSDKLKIAVARFIKN